MFTNIALAQGLKQAGGIMGDIAKKAGADTYSKPQELIGIGINAALAMVGLIFLVLMIYAGYLWLTSHGEEEPIKKAQKIIVSSVIGFILVVSAYAITVFVGKRFEVGGGGTSGETKECTPKKAGWSCQSIDVCIGKIPENYAAPETTEEKRTYCEGEELCELKLCPDDSDDIVCCADKAIDTEGNAGGDPNLQVCCWVCKEKLLGDFWDEPVLSGMMSEAACKMGCTGEDKDECASDYDTNFLNDQAGKTECDKAAKKVDCNNYESK